MAWSRQRAGRLFCEHGEILLAALSLPHTQIRRLLRHIDARLIWFSVALLSIDAFFIAVFSAHRIYNSLYDGISPKLGDEWHIGADWSYSEMFGYLKMTIIVYLLILIWRRWRRPIYLAFLPIFAFALLDDALQVHERLGDGIVAAFGLQPFAGLRAQDFGELIAWTAVAVPLLAGVLAAFVRSPQDDRSNGLLLMGAFAVLVVFAVVADMAHMMVRYTFRGSDLLLTLIEHGGEQITLSLICGLAVLIRREVHSREATYAVPD
jgi:hypothetical protein